MDHVTILTVTKVKHDVIIAELQYLGRQAEHHTQKNLWNAFIMVIMACGIACGYLGTMTMMMIAMPQNIAPILQLIGWPRHAPLVNRLTPVNSRYPLTSITWPYRWLKFRAHRSHVFFQSWPLPRYWFYIGLHTQGRLTYCNPRTGLWGSQLKLTWN